MNRLRLSSLVVVLIIAASCSPIERAGGPTGTPTISQEATSSPIPLEPPPTPRYLFSDQNLYPVELGQLFALRRDQSAIIASDNLTIVHTTDIEFECPADAECEVPLIAADYFEVIIAGESYGLQPWQPEMVIGDYLISTAKFYEGYDYNDHQFEIVLSVERLSEIISVQETKIAEFNFEGVRSNCGMTMYKFENRAWRIPEVHMLGIRQAALGHVDVYVQRSAAPLIIILSAYESTEWQIHRDDDVLIEKIILNGYHSQTLVGAGDIKVLDHSGPENHFVQYVYTWDTSYLGYINSLAPEWVYRIEAVAGVPLSTFTGCYQASEFTIQ